MRGRLIGYQETETEAEAITFHFNFREFESINVPMMSPLYYDDKGIPCRRAIDTPHYPKNGFGVFSVQFQLNTRQYDLFI